MKQLASTLNDRLLWGRCLQLYPRAFGTGSIVDPDAADVGFSEQLKFTMPIDEWRLREVWKSSDMSTANPLSAWFQIEKFSYFQVDMSGLKVRRGFFKGDCWIGALRFFFSNEGILDLTTVNVGNVAAKDIESLFKAFDLWLEGKRKVTGFDEAIASL